MMEEISAKRSSYQEKGGDFRSGPGVWGDDRVNFRVYGFSFLNSWQRIFFSLVVRMGRIVRGFLEFLGVNVL